MCASPFDFLRSGPPPPRVALIRDGLFFVRAVPIAPGATPADAVAQVELGLEAASPFPLDQLYHGYFWRPGAERALAFASYRRRFTAEQLAAWSQAELVLPAFAAILGAAVEPATTVVLAAPEGLTAVHWDHGPVPASVTFQPLAPEATDEDRAQARATLLRRVENKAVVDLAATPAPEAGGNDGEIVFRLGDFVSRLPAESIPALDVRDKEDLAALRRAHQRDIIFWRAGLGALAACALFVLLELALVAGGLWQTSRNAVLKAQAPIVDRIKTAQNLAHRIDELSTKRLLPLEMISIISGPKPPEIQFLSASSTTAAGGLYTLTVEAQTGNPGEIGGYQTALEALPACGKVEVRNHGTRNNVASFSLIVTFKPAALAPAAPAS